MVNQVNFVTISTTIGMDQWPSFVSTVTTEKILAVVDLWVKFEVFKVAMDQNRAETHTLGDQLMEQQRQ